MKTSTPKNEKNNGRYSRRKGNKQKKHLGKIPSFDTKKNDNQSKTPCITPKQFWTKYQDPDKPSWYTYHYELSKLIDLKSDEMNHDSTDGD